MKVEATLLSYRAASPPSYVGAAKLAVGETQVVVDDYCGAERRSIGSVLEVEIRPEFGVEEPWEQIFAGNPDRQRVVLPCGDGSYLALGCVVSIRPVVADCGSLRVRVPVWSNDPCLVGEQVGFRVGAFAAYDLAPD